MLRYTDVAERAYEGSVLVNEIGAFAATIEDGETPEIVRVKMIAISNPLSVPDSV